MTDPTHPIPANDDSDPTPTEDMMRTPTTSSPPETGFFGEPGTGQTHPAATEPLEPAESAEFAEPTETVSTGAHRPTLGDGPTVTYDGPQQPEPARGPRMRSIAWGLVIALLGVVVIAVGLGVRLDLQLVFIGILAVAGLTLLVGSLLAGGRRR